MQPRARNKDSKRSAERLYLWIALLLWIALILLLTVPWYGLQPEPRWDAIRWIPFVSRPRSVRDILVNLGLYVPVGYWLVRSMRGDP